MEDENTEEPPGALKQWLEKVRQTLQTWKSFWMVLPGFLRDLAREIWEASRVSRRTRAIAQNPDASVEELERACDALLQDDIASGELWFALGTVEALAAHPNLPPDSLVRLLNVFSTDAFAGLSQNPIFPLLTLERPDLPGTIDVDVARKILRHESLTAPIAGFLALHSDAQVVWEAENTVVLAGEIEEGVDWPALLEADVRRLCHSSPSGDSAWYVDHNRKQLFNLACMGIVPAEYLPHQDPCLEEEQKRRREILTYLQTHSPTIPTHLERIPVKNKAGQSLWYYLQLSEDPDEDEVYLEDDISIGDVLALHPDTPAEVLAGLVSHDPVRLRWVWNHPNTDVEVRANWLAFTVQALLQGYGSWGVAMYFVLTRLPVSYWRNLLPVWGDRNESLAPDPWVIFRMEKFGLLERCGALSLLPDPPQFNQHCRNLIHDLHFHNNRYMRAAVRERFTEPQGWRKML